MLTHGEEKNHVSAKDQYYEFDETLVNPIAKNITLLGCPKIFIINACRGYERNVYVVDSRYPEMEVDSCSKCLPNQRTMKNIPYMKEILKLYSCYEGEQYFILSLFSFYHSLRSGFVSYRNPLFGCRFINSLCKHLKERGRDTPIEDIFKLVCNELTDSSTCMYKIFDITKRIIASLTFINVLRFVQCPVVSSTLSTNYCLGDLLGGQNVTESNIKLNVA